MSYNKIEITKMTISDFIQIQDCLANDFDDFWSVSTLKEELNSVRYGYTLRIDDIQEDNEK